MKFPPFMKQWLAAATLVVCFFGNAYSQIADCPPVVFLECDEALPPPDPSQFIVTSYCKSPDCCDGQINPGDYCTFDGSGCMKVALTCIDVNEFCEPIFRFKVANTCTQGLSNIAFVLPPGTTGTDPAGGDIYTSPCGGTFNVETPTSGPDAGTIKFEGDLGQGQSTCFSFTLSGLDHLPDFITVNPKYGSNDVYLDLSTYGCGNSPYDPPVHVLDKVWTVGCNGLEVCRIYHVDFDCPVVASTRLQCQTHAYRDDDVMPPVLDFIPVNKTLACGEAVVFTPPTATDDCGPVVIDLVVDTELGGCPGETVFVRRWKVRDECFNYTQTVEQRITIPASCCPVQFHEAPASGTNPESGLSLMVFPNPAPGALTVQTEGPLAPDSGITIFSSDGRQVYQDRMNQVPRQVELPDGMYFVQLRSGDQVITRRIVVQR